MATVFIRPETNNNHILGSDNLTSGKIVEDIISMESNKYDTTNEQKQVSSMGLTPGKVYNTANTLEIVGSTFYSLGCEHCRYSFDYRTRRSTAVHSFTISNVRHLVLALVPCPTVRALRRSWSQRP